MLMRNVYESEGVNIVGEPRPLKKRTMMMISAVLIRL